MKGSDQAKCWGSGRVDALSVTKALVHGETVLKRMQRGGGRGTGWQVWGAGPRSEVALRARLESLDLRAMRSH